MPLKVYTIGLSRSTPSGEVHMRVRWSRTKQHADTFVITGTLNGLLRQYLHHYPPSTPAGIWIDRLQECPEELADATPEQVEAILTHLRLKHPDGI